MRDGQFSQPWNPNGTHPHWGFGCQQGRHEKQRVPIAAAMGTWSPHRLVLRTLTPGRCVVYQDVQLPPGRYALRFDVRTLDQGAGAVLIAGGSGSVNGVADWTETTVDFEIGDNAAARLHLYSTRPGAVEYRDLRLLTRGLRSSSVPCADGGPIGSVVLPEDASPPEEFAACELQWFVFRMTGRTPGLAGRDEVAEGRRILVGRAASTAQRAPLGGLSPESYLVDGTGRDLVLAGNTPTGTLYAVYAFLKSQGCGWYWPGRRGEVVPERETLVLPKSARVESPDYDVRGALVRLQEFLPTAGWSYACREDLRDWAARNRLNALWNGASHTIGLGVQRGHGHGQTVNHSWARFLVDEHPEWWVLSAGQRRRRHISGRPNMLCVSNPELRNAVAKAALEHFRDNPFDTVFALNPEDEPCFWCECSACCALDSEGADAPWRMRKDGWPERSMTERVLDFVNDIATRVTEQRPDRLIEVYAYGSYRDPPSDRKVHPNVLVKYTLWPGRPCNRPLLSPEVEANAKVTAQLDGWRRAGVRHFGLYDYGNYRHPDSIWLTFQHAADTIRTLHERWGFRNVLPESSNNVRTSFMMHCLRAELFWDVDTEPDTVIRQACERLYGPDAGPWVRQYYTTMHDVLMRSELWQEPDWKPLAMLEFGEDDLQRGTGLLERAWAAAGDDGKIRERLALARFAHAFTTFTVARERPGVSARERQAASKAHALANRLAREYGIRLCQGSQAPLKVLYFKPRVVETLARLPLEWRFRTDPGDEGLAAGWARATADAAWRYISTEKDWTSQGVHYHGVAWYSVEWRVPPEGQPAFGRREALALHFGAVDGDAQVFLDGKLLGKQDVDVAFMWDKPFALPLPDDFDPRVPHRLVVRVEKDRFAAGVWKPVTVVRLAND